MKQLQTAVRYRADHTVHRETPVSIKYRVAVGDLCPGNVGVVHAGGATAPPRTIRDYCPVCLALLEMQLVHEVSHGPLVLP